MKLQLLSPDSTNAKLAKNSAWSDIKSFILYLAPADSADGKTNLCPAASEGCKKACLFSAGRGAFANVVAARVRKSLWFISDRAGFLDALRADLEAVQKKFPGAAVRLNGTSDIAWEELLDMASYDLQFYDYTKRPDRAMAFAVGKLAMNYHLTFSRSEVNELAARRVSKTGVNVAVVFQGNALPATFWGLPVIDGTMHDLRFLDDRGVIVGLLAKGKAKKDDSNFVVKAS
jgi:hypothetical protein